MKENRIFTPPNESDNTISCALSKSPKAVKIFLGGTIDNGDSIDWQSELIKTIEGVELARPTHIYNPRRAEWPSADNHHEIDKQIDWELYHLERSNLIVMNILADSKSPISLMEIGLFAKEGKLMVFCPKTFYRYDNVRKVCERYSLPLYNTNNVPFIAEKVCEYIGIDDEAQRKANEELSKMADDWAKKIEAEFEQELK